MVVLNVNNLGHDMFVRMQQKDGQTNVTMSCPKKESVDPTGTVVLGLLCQQLFVEHISKF